MECDAGQRDAEIAEHREKIHDVRPQADSGTADSFERSRQWARNPQVRPRLEIDGMHLVDEAAMTRRQARELRTLAYEVRVADQPFQQPCADGVECLDSRHVEQDALRTRDLWRGGVDQALEFVRIDRSPGSASDEF